MSIRPDEIVDLDPPHQRVDVDPPDDVVDHDPLHELVDLDPPHERIDVDPAHQLVDLDPPHQRVDVESVDHRRRDRGDQALSAFARQRRELLTRATTIVSDRPQRGVPQPGGRADAGNAGQRGPAGRGHPPPERPHLLCRTRRLRRHADRDVRREYERARHARPQAVIAADERRPGARPSRVVVLHRAPTYVARRARASVRVARRQTCPHAPGFLAPAVSRRFTFPRSRSR